MIRGIQCSTCGAAGLLLSQFEIAIEEVAEECRDVKLVGKCPECGKPARVSLKEVVSHAQEALYESGD